MLLTQPCLPCNIQVWFELEEHMLYQEETISSATSCLEHYSKCIFIHAVTKPKVIYVDYK